MATPFDFSMPGNDNDDETKKRVTPPHAGPGVFRQADQGAWENKGDTVV
jgi:hypothetical protein